MNRAELGAKEKEVITGFDDTFVQSLEMVLSSLSDEPIAISPVAFELTPQEAFGEPCLVIQTEYIEGFSGKDRMIFKLKDAIPFTQLAMGEKIDTEVAELDELHQSVFSEIVSQVISSNITTISGKVKRKINFSFPNLSVVNSFAELTGDFEPASVIDLFFSLNVGTLLDSYFLYQIPKSWLDAFVEPAEKPAPPPQMAEKKEPPKAPSQTFAPSPLEPSPKPETPKAPSHSSPPPVSVPPPVSAAPPQQQYYQQPPPYQQAFTPPPQQVFQQQYGVPPPAIDMSGVMPVVQPARFSPLAAGPRVSPSNLDLYLDVPVKLTAVLGRAVLYLKDILEMGSGSVFELDRLAGEPIDLMVNNKLVARGEVVIIDEKFGVRVIETLDELQKKDK